MGVTLTDVLLFGKAQSDDVDNATLVIYRRNILRWSALGGYLDIIVKGVAPLSLPDAIANSLSYVKAFGGTEQRNIPQPYTQVNYVTNTASTAVNTGIMIDFAKNYEFEIEARATTGSWYILQSRETSASNITGISGSLSGNTITLVVGNVTTCQSAITRTVGNKLYVKATLNNGVATLYVKDETAGTEDTQTGSYGSAQPNPPTPVYLLGNAGGNYAQINSDIYMARIKENDTVVMDYVPARQVATAGFYDTVSGTFKTALTPANLSADGNTVPTPDAPMDIVSNNGALKARHQSGLPLGYTLLEYIESTGTQYIDTGVTGPARWIGRGQATADTTKSQVLLMGNQLGAGGTFVGSVAAKNKWTTWAPDDTDYPITSARTFDLTWTATDVSGTIDTTSLQHDYSSGVGLDVTWKICSNVQNFQFAGKLYYFKAYQNGTLVRDFIPCKNASNVVGMYDLVSGQFFTNAGTGDFVAGSAVSDPVEIYTDGTVETINVHGKNLLNPANIHQGTIASTSGVVVGSANDRCYFDFIKVKAGDVVYFSTKNNTPPAYGNIFIYSDASEESFVTFKAGSAFTFGDYSGYKYTITADGYVRGLILQTENFTPADVVDAQVVIQSSAPTAYAPYFNGGTATAEMLLKVGDYQDVQSIIDGVVTRNVGVKVLDGTENWIITSSLLSNMYNLSVSDLFAENTSVTTNRASPYCTHFQRSTNWIAYDSRNNCIQAMGLSRDKVIGLGYGVVSAENLDAFKQWLADQYAAGTPVIVVYPLATPTTESVAGQTLQVTGGDNVLEITQASLNNLELEAEYQAAVSLTIQEVQDANLDPNVEVTIN